MSFLLSQLKAAFLALSLLFVPAAHLGADITPMQISATPVIDKIDRFEVPFSSTIPDEGESKAQMMKDKPKVILSRWNGEAQMGIEYKNVKETASKNSNEVKYGTGKEVIHTYKKDDGSFEIEIELKSKPSANRFDFEITGAENLDFFYQPPLTEEYKDGWSDEFQSEILVTPTTVSTITRDERGIIYGHTAIERPENIVGSYAVYHKTKANHKVGDVNYATGKAYHILRPVITDFSGAKTYGDLSYANGTLTVTIPQKFLDDAQYPLALDPTFGYATSGGTYIIFNNTSPKIANIVSPLTAVSGDTITRYLIYFNKVSGSFPDDVAMTAYTVTGGIPSALVASGTSVIIGTTGWASSSIVNQVLSAGTVYCVALSMATLSGDTGNFAYDSGSAPGRFNSDSTTFTDPFNATGTDSGRHYSWYATYTAGGGAGGSFTPTTVIQGNARFEGNVRFQ
jgi:hypothetical protein